MEVLPPPDRSFNNLPIRLLSPQICQMCLERMRVIFGSIADCVETILNALGSMPFNRRIRIRPSSAAVLSIIEYRGTLRAGPGHMTTTRRDREWTMREEEEQWRKRITLTIPSVLRGRRFNVVAKLDLCSLDFSPSAKRRSPVTYSRFFVVYSQFCSRNNLCFSVTNDLFRALLQV